MLHGFKEQGNTVVVIEHNLDVAKTADWIIDLGPEGGEDGGRIVAQGTPEQVAQVVASHTGAALRRALHPDHSRRVGTAAVSKAGQRSAGNRRSASSEEGLDAIAVRGARQHNLKGIDLDIPRHKMTVCSGPSGSGKSSLAIDTLYAEGQRRYVESLSSYARQFLAPLQKPRVERISGLSPAISIEQKTTSKSPRSTVGTVTEIHDYLRILMARLGHPHCPGCGIPIGTQTADEIVEKILHLPEGTKVFIMAPVERRDGEAFEALWDELRASGFARVRVDGTSIELDSPPKLSHRRKHRIEVVIDRAVGADQRALAWPTLSNRRSTWARGCSMLHGSATLTTSPTGMWTVTASIVRATVADAASKSCRRTTSRSIARSAGARSVRAWARSMGPTRLSWCPTPGAASARALWTSGRASTRTPFSAG